MWISWFQSLPYKCNLYRCYAMQGKYDKTPDRDRDRKGGLGIKLGEQNAAYGAAVSCVKQVMGFDTGAAGL